MFHTSKSVRMMDTLTGLLSLSNLPHSWEGDVRNPLFTFSLVGETYGFYLNNVVQNVEVLLFLIATGLVGGAVARVLYQAVILPKRQDTSMAYLLGYGVIIPFWILSPMYIIQTLRITNKVFRFCMGTVPTLGIFRTMEVIHGFCPGHLTESMRTFALYYSCPFLALYDHKKQQFVKATLGAVLQRLMWYIQGMILTGTVHSLYELFPDIFPQFGTGNEFDKQAWYSWQEIFRWQRLWENLCFTVFFSIYLSTCAFGLQVFVMLFTGIQIEEMWVDPVSKSVSFSEFWARRWNLSVHTTLKRGVFKPVRRFFPKYVALASTFLASGLFHEWIVWLTFAPVFESISDARNKDSCPNASCFQPTYGPAIVFFLFQAMLIALEFLVGSHLKGFTDAIPTPLATLLVVCIGGSMAHWFSDGYVHSSFFLDAQVAYIGIKGMND
ncbi:long-chain-alcohol O-fatty-acyltransferase [Seminavis robusta]|uniref:Long-chain-alcohol O-fatty-acyltransferase n=1 Tax=Seminavis robusta TaxID=568900 RepID=A0A9N8DRS0_9STRA|nr:long-chain-alcohol O-fatty-acyltransferase [Seminavis robusta]|eukprot:Sro207_g086730.1 long-chain-alcohol O-fatty-acyltransferase (439) ;mRNA; r:4763-6368